MKVIWKRPDGFYQASPKDYVVVDISSQSRIWLHSKDHENFPFRVSGGWQDEKATLKLNRLVNLIARPNNEWVSHLMDIYEDSKQEDGQSFLKSMQDWLAEIRTCLKGDTWEVEIMGETIGVVAELIKNVSDEFLSVAKK